jgi:hypothetical protein
VLAAVPQNARLGRFVRGDFVGNAAADPELWDFCGDAGRREKLALTLAGDAGVRSPADSAARIRLT